MHLNDYAGKAVRTVQAHRRVARERTGKSRRSARSVSIDRRRARRAARGSSRGGKREAESGERDRRD